MSIGQHFNFVIIGSGPGGQKAAIQAAKSGKSVALIERERHVGGACVHHGTIPSKTLRESAMNFLHCQKASNFCDLRFKENIQVENLMTQKENVLNAHVNYMKGQLEDNQISMIRGRAKFIAESKIEITAITGSKTVISADFIIVATGSSPRDPETIPIDHENILDSDSILSMLYLPKSIVVLGGGVIACEYASFFATLGVEVTIVDTNPRALGFLDPEITSIFEHSFAKNRKCQFIGNQKVSSVYWDSLSKVITNLESGKTIESEKMLVALGRTANTHDLQTDIPELDHSNRGHILVNENYQTNIPHIYAVGDVIGFPALASCSMEQGRRAVCHALKIDPGSPFNFIPMGIYTIPEISSVGLTEDQAKNEGHSIETGFTRYDEVARGQISDIQDGMLKLIADRDTRKLLGVHIIGEGATELIHMGQLALLAGFTVDVFVENVMNFPTLAEAYRIAALNLINKISISKSNSATANV